MSEANFFQNTGIKRKRHVRAAVMCLAWALPGAAAFAVQPGDVEPNEVVDLRDLLDIRNHFGETGAPGFIGADVDGDGDVDNADLLTWRDNFPFVGNVDVPYIFISYPLDGSLIGDRRPTVIVDFSPTGLNVDPASFQINLDGVDQTAEAVVSSRNAVLFTEQALGDGPHFVEASIDDVQGHTATYRSDFQVTAITLLPRATPVVGPAPLTVSFYPDVIWADNPPSHYLWDFDNNGTFDNGCIGCFDASARPDVVTFTFNEEGVRTVRFAVYQGATATLTETTLNVAVTESFASVSPSNGTAPLTVFLHGIAADLSDPIVLFEWDFDYSGSFSADFSSPSSASTIHLYTTPGVYHPVFRATHTSGAIVEHPIVQQELHVGAVGFPLATAAASQGSDALTVNFAGSGSDNGAITLYEWDFDNDGAFDFSSPATGVTSHTYPTAGVKVAALRVTDNEANTTLDRVRFETFAPASLEVLDDTVVPADDEEVIIRTTLTIESTVNLFMRSKDGRVIRTLVNNEVRAAGTYDDTWDGLDSRYEPAHPDAYYAVLEYTYPGRTDTVDLTDTTGGVHYFAARTTPNPPSLDPFSDNFWEMGFTIPSASRASLYILPGGSNRTDTPFDNLPLGAGNYTYYWAGLNSQDQLAPTSAHLWTVNGWTLGDNTVVVKATPAVNPVSVNPNFFSPSNKVPLVPTADVAFESSSRVTFLLKVVRLDNGITLRSWRTPFLDPGPQTIAWDGRAEGGELVSPGDYRFSFLAVDEKGNVSIERDSLVKIQY